MTKKQERLNFLTAIHSALDEELNKNSTKPIFEQGNPIVIEIDRVRLTQILNTVEKVLALDGIHSIRGDSLPIQSTERSK